MKTQEPLLKIRFDGKAVDLLPQGTPIARSFWDTPSLDELAITQNVEPLFSVHALVGTWPGDDDDGFEASIDDLRHHEIGGGNSKRSKSCCGTSWSFPKP